MDLLLQQSHHRRFGWLLWLSSISPLSTTPSSPSPSSHQPVTLPLSLSGGCCLGFASIREFHQIWAPLDALLYGGRRRRNCFFFLLLASLSTSELLSSLSFALQKCLKMSAGLLIDIHVTIATCRILLTTTIITLLTLKYAMIEEQLNHCVMTVLCISSLL